LIATGGARLGRHLLMGRPRDELVSGLRSVLVPPHVIFYRAFDERVEVARILHQRRDLGSALTGERDDETQGRSR
jgi:plasmid stabilization system protein ParE